MTKLLLVCILSLTGIYGTEATTQEAVNVCPHTADLKAGPPPFVPLDIIKMR